MSNIRCKVAVHAFFLSAWIFQVHTLFFEADVFASEPSGSVARGEPLEERRFSPLLNGKWRGQGISYGPYREKQSPGGLLPTDEELTEDLNLLAQHWNLIRMYGSRDVAENVLKIIQAKKLPLRIMLGAWITRESESETLGPTAAKAAALSNRQEVTEVIRLANGNSDCSTDNSPTGPARKRFAPSSLRRLTNPGRVDPIPTKWRNTGACFASTARPRRP